ncbi:hypothetical protein AciX8_4790 [Granulicella mallensis MP5ACTX8]|uniref:Uncharacterized protein n=1 Tax=Granulicella mallensis (strain ATCC BAA-1857 / DSM 23137 / MP5ACTX8) TaxID=682795 RepID=G8NYK0_GRAMM|nr:hypothetical protein AciX8_4790 [Granulicella mallensis MP5ACTX8]
MLLIYSLPSMSVAVPDEADIPGKGSNCDNRLLSGKPRHIYCRNFESAEHCFDVFLISTSALLVHADYLRMKLCESVFLACLYLDMLIP